MWFFSELSLRKWGRNLRVIIYQVGLYATKAIWIPHTEKICVNIKRLQVIIIIWCWALFVFFLNSPFDFFFIFNVVGRLFLLINFLVSLCVTENKQTIFLKIYSPSLFMLLRIFSSLLFVSSYTLLTHPHFTLFLFYIHSYKVILISLYDHSFVRLCVSVEGKVMVII